MQTRDFEIRKLTTDFVRFVVSKNRFRVFEFLSSVALHNFQTDKAEIFLFAFQDFPYSQNFSNYAVVDRVEHIEMSRAVTLWSCDVRGFEILLKLVC